MELFVLVHWHLLRREMPQFKNTTDKDIQTPLGTVKPGERIGLPLLRGMIRNPKFKDMVQIVDRGDLVQE